MSVILVTGGSGFIGLHTCHLLLKNGYKVIILDSFINSNLSFIQKLSFINSENFDNNLEIIKGDLRNQLSVRSIFNNAYKRGEPIESVIHFAGLKSISESIEDPTAYWDVNVRGSINIFKVMEEFGCRKIIFSSSALVYDLSIGGIYKEDSPINPQNPYGKTKFVVEGILEDLSKKYKDPWQVVILRYFNPIGAHESGLIGDNPSLIKRNIFPIICDVAAKEKHIFQIYGKNWETIDGTPVRDYIHIMDLAEAHLEAYKALNDNKIENIVLNIGTGKGTSVLELINIFEEANNLIIPYEYVNKRNGDQGFLVADNRLSLKVLNWRPKRNIHQMCKDGWNFKKRSIESKISLESKNTFFI